MNKMGGEVGAQDDWKRRGPCFACVMCHMTPDFNLLIMLR